MGITITPTGYLTDVDLCEAVGSWTSLTSGAPSLDTVQQIQGSGCMATQAKATMSDTYYYPGSWNLTGKHVYIWMNVNGLTASSDGYQIYLYDGTNSGYWYVGGGLQHQGWNCFVIDPSTTPDSGSSVTVSSITRIGVRFNVLTSVVGTAKNCFWDAVRVGDGYKITSLDTDTITLEDIYNADSSSSYSYGIVGKKNGVYTIQGKLRFGDDTSGDIVFSDSAQVVVFPDNSKVSDSFYGIEVLANSGGTTKFQLGTKSGDSGISGCVLKAIGSKSFSFDVSDGDIDELKIYGTSFLGGGAISFPAAASGREVISCNFEECGQVVPSSVSMRKCNFINTSDADSALLWNEDIDIGECSFISNTNGAGIEMPSAVGSPYVYDNLQFSGNTYDVYNSSGSAIVISKTNGSNPSTYEGSTVTFVGAAVDTVITVKDLSTGSVISGARVLVWVTNGVNFPYLASVSIVGSGTTATVTHTAHGLATGDNVIIRGANEDVYNGAYTITKINDDSYSYQTNETIGISPATGTITATFAFINTNTDGSGVAKDEDRLVNNDQSIEGWVRKGSSSPYYEEGKITGTVSSSSGYALIVLLARDE